MAAPEIDSADGVKVGGVLIQSGTVNWSHNASHHVDRTRYITLSSPHYPHDAPAVGNGITLTNVAPTYVTYNTFVPTDFVSYGNLYIYYKPQNATGNVVLDITTYYQSDGESVATHTDSDNDNVIATSDTNMHKFTTTGLFGSLASGDMISIQVTRDTAHGSDTNPSVLVIMGVVFEYTADM